MPSSTPPYAKLARLARLLRAILCRFPAKGALGRGLIFGFASAGRWLLFAAMKSCRVAVVLLGLAVLTGCAHRSQRFEFALIGDMPYTDQATTNLYPNLIREIDAADLAFVVHDGDIKSGSQPCTDEIFRQRLTEFQAFQHPLFFIFGDNEWQDCGNNKTNKFDPMERLNKLREIFCGTNASLGRQALPLERQSPGFPENIRWIYKEVLFAGFNIPGGVNNFGKPEFKERNAANCTWLKETFALAKREQHRGVMLIIQANPHFDLAATNQVRRGFNEWLGVLEREVTAFGKPVVLVHGDSHYFRIDKPLVSAKTGQRVPHFTRVETFGYPDVHWLRARVDPRNPNLFSFDIQLVEENLRATGQ